MDPNPFPPTRRRGLAAGAVAALALGLAAGVVGAAGPAGASSRTSAWVSHGTLTVTVNGTARRDHVNVSRDHGEIEVDGLRPGVDVSGSDTSDLLQVNTVGGDDDVDVDDDALDLIGVAVDLGAGQR